MISHERMSYRISMSNSSLRRESDLINQLQLSQLVLRSNVGHEGAARAYWSPGSKSCNYITILTTNENETSRKVNRDHHSPYLEDSKKYTNRTKIEENDSDFY